MTREPVSENLRGAGLMMASMAFFTLGDACIKAIGTAMPLAQTLTLRGLVATAFIWLLARRLRQLRFDLPRRDWGLIAARAGCEAAAAYFFLSALLHMPFANVTAILQVLPLTITLAAALFLGEAVGWRRWTAIAVGFAGMLLIVRPGAEGFTAWSVYALIAVGFVTVRDLATRRMSAHVPSLTVTLVSSGAVTVFAALWSLGVDWQPMRPATLAQLAGASAFIVAAYTLSVQVMRHGDVSFVSPFRYTALVWALVLGLVLFGEWPDPVTLLGASIIVATGVFTLVRGARTGAPQPAPNTRRT